MRKRIQDMIKALKAEFRSRQKRNPQYSLRALARDLDVSKSTVSEIWRGKCDLSARTIAKVQIFLGQENSSTQIPGTVSPSEYSRDVNLSHEEFALVSSWHHFAILAAIEAGAKADSKVLSEKFGIDEGEVQSAIDRLFNLKLLKVHQGRTVKSKRGIVSLIGERLDEAHRAHQAQIFERAQIALDKNQLSDLAFDNRFVSMGPETQKRVFAKIERFTDDISASIRRAVEPNKRVYLLSFQAFPLD